MKAIVLGVQGNIYLYNTIIAGTLLPLLLPVLVLVVALLVLDVPAMKTYHHNEFVNSKTIHSGGPRIFMQNNLGGRSPSILQVP